MTAGPACLGTELTVCMTQCAVQDRYHLIELGISYQTFDWRTSTLTVSYSED